MCACRGLLGRRCEVCRGACCLPVPAASRGGGLPASKHVPLPCELSFFFVPFLHVRMHQALWNPLPDERSMLSPVPGSRTVPAGTENCFKTSAHGHEL